MELANEKKVEELEEEGKFKWRQKEVHKLYLDSGKSYYIPKMDKMYLFKCLRCGKPHIHLDCPNCGNKDFMFGESDNRIGLFCSSCERGFTEWVCVECETRNPVAKTFYQLEKSGCFIATAIYGTPIANEVIILKEFRDSVLLNYFLGKQFVKLYYRFSPPIAEYIAKHDFLKNTIRKTIIVPFIKFIKKIGS